MGHRRPPCKLPMTVPRARLSSPLETGSLPGNRACNPSNQGDSPASDAKANHDLAPVNESGLRIRLRRLAIAAARSSFLRSITKTAGADSGIGRGCKQGTSGREIRHGGTPGIDPLESRSSYRSRRCGTAGIEFLVPARTPPRPASWSRVVASTSI